MAKEEFVQQRMLRAIILNGGIATTRELAQITKLSINSINGGGRHLKQRGLIRRKVINFIENNIPRKLRVYSVFPNREVAIERVLKQMPEGWSP